MKGLVSADPETEEKEKRIRQHSGVVGNYVFASQRESKRSYLQPYTNSPMNLYLCALNAMGGNFVFTVLQVLTAPVLLPKWPFAN